MIRRLATSILTICFLSAVAPSHTKAQTSSAGNHVITVSRGGEAFANPDLGIMVMTLRSAAPIAEEAVAENGRKAAAVEASLGSLGFAPAGYKITSVVFGEAGGSHYGPGQQEIT